VQKYLIFVKFLYSNNFSNVNSGFQALCHDIEKYNNEQDSINIGVNYGYHKVKIKHQHGLFYEKDENHKIIKKKQFR